MVVGHQQLMDGYACRTVSALQAVLFLNSITWIYSMQILYPQAEIYPADDDVSGAFRHEKYHPNLVGMHSCIVLGRVL
jgi:hypothetical protein